MYPKLYPNPTKYVPVSLCDSVIYLRMDSSLVIMPQGTIAEADCITAWLKRFLDSGESKWRLTEAPPADSPKMVMLLGLPPNWAMLSRIHVKAINWSKRPALPGTSSVSKNKKPNEATRYWRDTTMIFSSDAKTLEKKDKKTTLTTSLLTIVVHSMMVVRSVCFGAYFSKRRFSKSCRLSYKKSEL